MHTEIEKVLAEIKDETLRAFTSRCIEKIHDSFIKQAGSTKQHHAWPGGLLMHSVSVALLGKAIADHYVSMGCYLNRDVVVAGGLLQDIGKVLCYAPKDATYIGAFSGQPEYVYRSEQYPPNKIESLITHQYEKTYEDSHFHHIPIGFHMAMTVAEQMDLLSNENVMHVIHLIISHHGKKEWSSPQTPKTMEALICHTADQMDATMFAAPDFKKVKMEGGTY